MTFLIQAEKAVKKSLADSSNRYSEDEYLLVNIAEQKLFHSRQKEIVATFPVSTAKNGVGSDEDSGKTPLGLHRIAEKIGGEAPEGTLFRARQSTGQVVTALTEKGNYSDLDAITSRILWLDGLELGKNKGGSVDSYSRYIYIHGTDEEWRLGTPVSHGCIRMSNQDIITLYDTVCVNTLVVIL